MSLFTDFDQSETQLEPFKRPSHLPKCDSEDAAPTILNTGYFPIPITLINGIAASRLTPSVISFLLLMMSRFNRNNDGFFISDGNIMKILGFKCTKTVQRAREKLKELGWLMAKEGGIVQRGPELEYRTTQYYSIYCPGFNNDGLEAKTLYLKMERSTFAFLLQELQKKRITPRHFAAYLTVRYFGWRESQVQEKLYPDFTMSKGELRGLFGIDDTPKLIMELSRIPLPDGEPLFYAIEKCHSLEIAGLRDCPTVENCTSGPAQRRKYLH